jgi:hypothetical protein
MKCSKLREVTQTNAFSSRRNGHTVHRVFALDATATAFYIAKAILQAIAQPAFARVARQPIRLLQESAEHDLSAGLQEER